MRNRIFFLFVMALAVVLTFSSCEETEMFESPEASGIVIKMSIPEGEANAGALKSASAAQPIQAGDTVDIYNLKMMNIIFSAEDENAVSLSGNWNISLIDCDNDTDFQRLANGPSSFVQSSNIASLKPSELGLYMVHFQIKNNSSHFYLRHKGLPGSIGDDYENNYAFRMEKKLIQDYKDDNKLKTAYTLYLRINPDEFKAWNNDYDGVNPNNQKTWQALLNSSTSFFLRKAIYSEDPTLGESYFCFTFFPEDTPPADRWGGGKSYSVQFYAGEYGQNWWTFKSSYETAWKKGFSTAIEFMPI
ncbi:hypothetical protein JXK06_01750 [Patescibacteria group bacterium]|nr:hypothetical protein [Patescibacteria group bacterium]